MDTRQLRSFLHVAELGSISAAAERLNTAQPALSRMIQSIEDDLGAKLFLRHARGVQLTEVGRAFVPRAMTILDELDRARSEARGRVALLSGDIAIGLPPTVADVLASALAVRIIKQYPQVKLRILSSYSGYILDALQRGGVDIAILYHGPAERTVKARPLLTERLMAIGPAGRLAAGEAGIAFETLTRQPLILPSRRHGLRLLLDAAAARMGQELVPIVETDSLGVQIDLVRRGLGFTVLPLVAAFADVQAGRLSAAPIVDPPLERRLTVALPSDRPVSPGAAQLEHLVREEVARLVEGGGWSAQLAGG